MSSANITGAVPAVTAPAATAAFDALLVLDGDPWRGPSVAHGSTTIVRIGGNERLEVARRGINDADHTDPADYAGRLWELWSDRPRGARESR